MDDAYSIRVAKTELREGYNTGDVDRVLSVYRDVYSDMSSGCASFYGGEAKAVLRHRLTKLFATHRAHLAVTIISIGIEGSTAFDWGWHQLTLTPKSGGRPKTVRTRYLEIWQKQTNGQWKIAIFFDNVDRPPAMPPREVMESLFTIGSNRSRTAPVRRRKASRTSTL
jgi:ketosteroid isomerase-like protein